MEDNNVVVSGNNHRSATNKDVPHKVAHKGKRRCNALASWEVQCRARLDDIVIWRGLDPIELGGKA